MDRLRTASVELTVELFICDRAAQVELPSYGVLAQLLDNLDSTKRQEREFEVEKLADLFEFNWYSDISDVVCFYYKSSLHRFFVCDGQFKVLIALEMHF